MNVEKEWSPLQVQVWPVRGEKSLYYIRLRTCHYSFCLKHSCVVRDLSAFYQLRSILAVSETLTLSPIFFCILKFTESQHLHADPLAANTAHTLGLLLQIHISCYGAFPSRGKKLLHFALKKESFMVFFFRSSNKGSCYRARLCTCFSRVHWVSLPSEITWRAGGMMRWLWTQRISLQMTERYLGRVLDHYLEEGWRAPETESQSPFSICIIKQNCIYVKYVPYILF